MTSTQEQSGLCWGREILRLIWDSQYEAFDDHDRFRILRHRKLRRIKLFIYRGGRKTATEIYDYLPSVREAKAFAETRRRFIGIGVAVENRRVW